MSLIKKLEDTGNYKKNSIQTYKKILKVIGLEDATEEDLKGKIPDIINKIKAGKYKNDKVYYNAVYLIYNLCNFDKNEMDLVKIEYKKSNKKNDIERRDSKIEYKSERFKYTLSDVQKVREKYKELYNKNKKPIDAVNYLLASLSCDDNFGPKRMVDLMNLKWSNVDIENRQIKFTAEKNDFKYTSKELSDDIFNPLELLYYLKLNKEYVLVTKKNEPFGRQNISKRFKQIFKDLPGLNSQNIRSLWASEKYAKSNKIKDVLEHAYELNHTIQSHYSSYLSPVNP
jgi:integrase